jgi:16S rRNA C1402 (ribose-2'-O) methylase RsmI
VNKAIKPINAPTEKAFLDLNNMLVATPGIKIHRKKGTKYVVITGINPSIKALRIASFPNKRPPPFLLFLSTKKKGFPSFLKKFVKRRR